MRRLMVAGLLFSFATVSSCFDTRLPTAPLGSTPGAPVLTEETSCTPKSYTDLQAMVNTAFGAGSPNANSALGKLDNINKHLQRGETATAQSKTYDLVDFILTKNAESPLPGGEAAVTALVNELFCFVGLSNTITDPDNSWVVEPTDTEQIFITQDGKAGLKISGNNVEEYTLIQIIPGNANDKLNTKLDQHAPIYHYTKSGSNSFKSPVIVALCANPGLDNATFANLAVGHGGGQDEVFEILPEEDGTWLPCEDEAPSFSRSSGGASLSVSASSSLTTFQTRGGGVAGATGTFSHFGVVDTRACSSTSCATGTFNLIDAGAGITFNGISTFSTDPCPTSYVVGSEVRADCRPTLTLQTPLGTKLASVPITFAVTAGGGTVGLVGTPCTNFAASKIVNTDANGTSTVCWTLGNTAGTNTVAATPGYGGDAPAGTTFVPTSLSFELTALPIVSFPGSNQVNWFVDQSVTVTCTYNGSASPDPCNPVSINAVSPPPSGFAGTTFPKPGVIFRPTNTVTPVAGGPSFVFYVRTTYQTLCNISKSGAVVTDPKLGESLCAKLSSAQASDLKGDTKGRDKALDTYIAQVQTQTGKQLIAAYSAHLQYWATWCKTNSCLSPTFPSASIGTTSTLSSPRLSPAPRSSGGPAIRQ